MHKLFLLLSFTLSAQSTIHVSTLPPARVYFTVVSTANAGPFLPAEFQFDIDLGAGNVIPNGVTFTIGSTAANAGKQITIVDVSGNTVPTCVPLGPDGKYRCLVWGTNKNVIPPGALVNLNVQISNVLPKSISPILSNVSATDPIGNSCPLTIIPTHPPNYLKRLFRWKKS